MIIFHEQYFNFSGVIFYSDLSFQIRYASLNNIILEKEKVPVKLIYYAHVSLLKKKRKLMCKLYKKYQF